MQDEGDVMPRLAVAQAVGYKAIARPRLLRLSTWNRAWVLASGSLLAGDTGTGPGDQRRGIGADASTGCLLAWPSDGLLGPPKVT